MVLPQTGECSELTFTPFALTFTFVADGFCFISRYSFLTVNAPYFRIRINPLAQLPHIRSTNESVGKQVYGQFHARLALLPGNCFSQSYLYSRQ